MKLLLFTISLSLHTLYTYIWWFSVVYISVPVCMRMYPSVAWFSQCLFACIVILWGNRVMFFVFVSAQVSVTGFECVAWDLVSTKLVMVVREQQVGGRGEGGYVFTLHTAPSELLWAARSCSTTTHCFSRAHPFSSLCSFIKAHSNQHDSPLCTFILQTGMKTGH